MKEESECENEFGVIVCMVDGVNEIEWVKCRYIYMNVTIG